MVEYTDGSVIAQVSATDMRMPIQYALTYPERWMRPCPGSTGARRAAGSFFLPIIDKFPAAAAGIPVPGGGRIRHLHVERGRRDCCRSVSGGTDRFSGDREMVEETLSRMPARNPRSVGDVLEIDCESRAIARDWWQRAPATSRYGLRNMLWSFLKTLVAAGPDRGHDPDPRAGTLLGSALSSTSRWRRSASASARGCSGSGGARPTSASR